ncbi:YaaC family protein [Deinococcus sp. UYEF24]
MTKAETWDRLLMFESTDLIKRYYKAKHGGVLNSTKASEIAAHFTQGREYFRSSDVSSNYVKPLLQYYGVLALARGLILFLDKDVNEAGLKPSHGVTSTGWNETLAIPENILNLEVRIEANGTLPHLVKLTNRQNYPVFIPPVKIKLDEIFSRIPEFDTLYREIFSIHSNCFLAARIEVSITRDPKLIIFSNEAGLPKEEDIRKVAGVGKDSIMKIGSNVLDKERFGSVMYFDLEPDSIMPVLESYAGGSSFVISAFESGVTLGILPRMFILSYFMGMLVRYNPTRWISIVNRQSNNVIYPILQSASRLIENSYPARILERLEESPS